MLKKTILNLSVVAALLATSGIALSATATSTINVSASVSKACTISTTQALAFGAYDPIGANLAADLLTTGSVTVTCSKGSTGMAIALNDGTHGASGQRQMLLTGGTAADILQYNIYLPPSTAPATACAASGGTAWNATSPGNVLTLTNAPSKAGRLYNVCGSIPMAQDAPTGDYSDVVTATLTF
ncbi:MAG: spore coat protein U domain-containing protein [Sterolibacterium sp.]